MSKRILFILDMYHPHIGGWETLFKWITEGLAQKGYSIDVLTAHYDSKLPIYEELLPNLRIHRVGGDRYRFMFACLWKWYHLAKKADIIHTATYNSMLPASMIAVLTNRKIVVTVHEIFGALWYRFFGWKGWFFKRFENLLGYLRFDHFVAVSRYTANSLRLAFRLHDDQISVVYNAVDYEIWNPDLVSKPELAELRESLDLQGKVVGIFFGRSGISKGLPYYIAAIPEIIKTYPNFRALLIVSESKNNPAHKERALIKELGVESSVVWLSSRPYREIKKYLLMSDVTIIPSLAEGFGIAAAEASALGVPLVVSEIAALPEAVSGRVVFVRSADPHSIARWVIASLNGESTIIPAKRFTWAETVEGVERVYTNLLSK